MASGQKFGKSEAGAIYLDPKLTSPYKFYQFWINVDDRDVEKYLKLFTLKSQAEIAELVGQHKKDPAARIAQKALAEDVTTRAHGADAVKMAVAASAKLFTDSGIGTGMSDSDLEALSATLPTVPVKVGETLVDALVRTGLVKSKSEARRAIEGGGIYLNEDRIEDMARTIVATDFNGRFVVLRKGKKDNALLRREG
jgi:tyrosyl-tRNA synthetase